MGKESKRKHLIDPNNPWDMLVLWKLSKYCFLFPCLGGNPRTSHPLEKGEHALMRASGAEAKIKVQNQGWYWITLLYLWMQTGLLFSYVVVPSFGVPPCEHCSWRKLGSVHGRQAFGTTCWRIHALWSATQGSLAGIPGGRSASWRLAFREPGTSHN